MAIGKGNTLYFGYAQDTTSGSGKTSTKSSAPYVAVSRDKGATWTSIKDVSSGAIKNVQFPTMVSGDDGRAALAFLGTSTAGDDQAGSWSASPTVAPGPV